jgi:hypothetical protein
MWLVNFVQGKNLLLEKTYWVTVGGHLVGPLKLPRHVSTRSGGCVAVRGW